MAPGRVSGFRCCVWHFGFSLLLDRALLTETKVESGTSESKSGTSVEGGGWKVEGGSNNGVVCLRGVLATPVVPPSRKECRHLVHGLCFIVDDLWFMVYGLWFKIDAL